MEPWAFKICFARRPIGLLIAPLLTATAKTCCAPLCSIASVGHQVSVNVTYCARLSRCDSFASQLNPPSRNPTAFWTLFIASPEVALMRRRLLVGLLHHGPFPTGQRLSARQRCSEFALAGYPRIDTDSYPSPHPARWAYRGCS